VIILLTWASDRTPPADIIVMDTPTSGYQAGEYLTIEWALNGDTDHCKIDVKSKIVDSAGYVYELYEPKEKTTREGHNGLLNTQYRLPEAFPSGRGKYTIEVSYRCNPIQRIWPVVASTQTNFTVAPHAGGTP
jgi:hypothetical protein